MRSNVPVYYGHPQAIEQDGPSLPGHLLVLPIPLPLPGGEWGRVQSWVQALWAVWVRARLYVTEVGANLQHSLLWGWQ